MLSTDLEEQSIHVTLKAGPEAKRVDRKVLQATGQGEIEVAFDIPSTLAGSVVQFAAFIGKDYATNLQHLQTSPVKVQ